MTQDKRRRFESYLASSAGSDPPTQSEHHARVAQQAEQLHGKQQVSGSIPLPGSAVARMRYRQRAVPGHREGNPGTKTPLRNPCLADIAQLVARHVANVKVAGSNPVVRSRPLAVGPRREWFPGCPRPGLQRLSGPHVRVAQRQEAHGSDPWKCGFESHLGHARSTGRWPPRSRAPGAENKTPGTSGGTWRGRLVRPMARHC